MTLGKQIIDIAKICISDNFSLSDQEKLEKSLLHDQIEYVYGHSKMYQDKFSKADITKDKIKDVEDLALLPFSTKQELRNSQKRLAPFGDFLAAPAEKVSRVHRTSGTTGSFVYTALTKQDLDLTHNCGARAFWAGGLRPHHRVVHCLNYCMWMGGYTDHANLETTGATVIPFGVGNSRQLIQVIKDAGINAISSTPSYPRHLEKIIKIEFNMDPAGEMVLTHLKKEAQPLVRYQTSDLMEILETGPCECGRTGFRFRIVGRADDMLHVKGINVFPNGIAMVLEDIVPEVTGEFQIILNHPSPYTGLDIKVEHGINITQDKMIDLKLKIEKKIK